jgi:hypothetical protein
MFPLAMKEQVSLQAVLKNRLESLRIRYPSYSMRADSRFNFISFNEN